ncbi:MAG: methylmalonyl-CoA epimerase [Chloroflexi bacterium]|nr:methylmalonyl-CoA epimerase [Chloroflexota bacterium]
MTEVCTVNYIDHVGVAVKDIEVSLAFFRKVFDVPDAEIELMEDQGVRAALVEVGQTRLELLEPTSPESGVGRFIERRGEGLHHLAFNVTDISGKLQTLKTMGVDLIDQTPREGLSGTIAFVHPRSIFGILTELVESVPKS